MKTKIQNLFIALTLFITGGAGHCATITWTNTAGGNWSVAANWNPNVVPGQLNTLNSADDVLITNAGTYTVVLDEGTSPNFWDIHTLTLGAGGSGTQTLAMTNKILYVAPLTVTNGGVLAANTSDFHATITVANGGQLNSTNGNYFVNPLTIANGGTFTTKGSTIFESGGVLENGGALNISNGVLTLDMTATNSGAMTVSSGAGLTIGNALTLLDPLTNSGTMTIAENTGGAISISNNLSTTRGGIVNLSGATINLDNAKGITGGNNHEFLINQGAINSTGGGYIQSVPGLTNSGTINVSATTLNLDSGLHLESSGSLNVQLNSASDYGKIAVSGNVALNGALNVALGNGFNPQNGNSFQPVTYGSFSGNFTSTNLPTLVPWQMSYGSSAVTLSVTTRTITWTNTLGGNWSDPNNWSPNIVPGGAAYGNDDDAQITASGNYTVVLDEGSVSTAYYLHSLTLGAGSGVQALVVTNTWPDVGSMSVNAGGQVNSSGSYWFNNWVTPLTIAGGGIFNSTNDLFNQHVTVNSAGIFTAANSTNGNGWFVITGALNVSAGILTLNGPTTNSGTMTVSNGASIAVNDNLVLSGAGGIVNLAGGAIDIAGGDGISGDNGAEYLSNQGAINSSGGYILSVPGFTNSGQINSLTGTLDLDSDAQLQSSGSLYSQLNSASDYGKIVINGNAALNGVFGIMLNYSPAAGDSFTPLTYNSYSGNFNNLNLPTLGTGQSWQTSLGATALTLQVAEAVTWTNTAGGNWSAAANWNPNKVPGQYDDVGITTPGTYTVNVDASPNIKSLALGAGSGTQTLVVSNKTFYVNPLNINSGGILLDPGSFGAGSTYHAVINVQNGGQLISTNGTFYGPITIDGGGQMTAAGSYQYVTFHGNVNDGGILTIPPGGVEVAKDGSLTVADGGVINIPNGRLFLYGPMTNSGTVYLTEGNGTTDIEIDNDGTANDLGFLLNQPGGTIVLNGNPGEIDTGAGPDDKFINQGVIINTNSHAIYVSDFDTSAGVVTNWAGTLTLGTFTNTLAGIFYATNGATIQFHGGAASDPLKPGNPLVLVGGGQFQFISYGGSSWLDLTNDIIPNLQLVGGFLELETTFQGGVITNLALDGITLTNAAGITWAVTNGIFAVTNSAVYGNFTVQNTGQLDASGGTFYDDVMVANGGLLNVSSGQVEIANGGSLTVDANGTMDIIGGAYLELYGPLTNSGTINMLGNNGNISEISLYYGGSYNYQGGIWNLPGGTINLNYVANGYSYIGTSSGSPPFVNQGVIISATTTPSGRTISVGDFDNSAGVVTNLTGTMDISVFTNTLAGTFYTTNGTTIRFEGGAASNPLKPGSPLALLGGGSFQFYSGWLDLPDNVISNLDLHGGYLELEPTFQGGVITNLVLDGITLTNASEAAWVVTNGIFAVTNSSIYGDVAVKNGGQLIAAGNSGTPTFYGNVTVEAGGLLTLPLTWAEIANGGSLTVEANGIMNIGGAYLQLYGPLTNSGTINLLGNNGVSEILPYNGTSYNYQGGIWNLPGGTVNLDGVANNYSIIQSGSGSPVFINQGAIVANPGAQPSIINLPGFTNSGAITALTGTFNLHAISLQPSGSLNVRLNSKTDYGKFSISGAATLTGAFGASLNGIYVPGVGDSFQPLTYGSYTGSFIATNLPPLVAWQTTYGATALTLLVTQTGLIPEFTTFNWSGGNLIFNGTNGAPGNTYWVLASTNLTQPLANWTPVATNIFDGNGKFSYTNTVDLHQPQQFFIIELQ